MVRAIAVVVLVVFGSIGVFLFIKSVPTFRHYGWSFFTEVDWNPESNKVGVAAALIGTVEVAIVALVVAFPLALCTAVFISEYAPPSMKGANERP